MKHLILYCSLFLLFISCNFKPCEKVTDKDVVGYYTSDNPANKGKQYIRILENHTFIMAYCHSDSIIIEQGTWGRHDGCHVWLNGIRWFNIIGERDAEVPSYGSFIWVRGKLAMGEYIWSFQKTWRKPKLVCEK